ncbi:DUF4436 domain-containing protein [Mycobacterium asiaticum]|uniref:DUF4436 domain-containing protein n=1 Tax=Mycobacterium asiaticum TaxID=1790 RepID=A0A1A3NW41_MYCAS|nr:DUF4436 domain-containing protein [Mycobacterium asiaticum]OBK24557.1 DUF4436 domain-containing protein [Mycobacterium asiaticum]
MSLQTAADNDDAPSELSEHQPGPPEPPERKPGPPEHKHMSVRKHLVLDTSILIGFAACYLFVLSNYQLLAPRPLPPVDLGTMQNAVVKLHIEDLRNKDNLLQVKMVLKPDESIVNKRTGRLTADTAVRFAMQDDLGEVPYAMGKAPEPVEITIEARGEPRNWPFDSYTTDPIRAEWLVGAAEDAHYEPAKVEVDGAADGFDIDVQRVDGSANDVVITLKRTRAQLLFDIGICLVLITLPALALFVAIQMVTRRRPFLPPFSTWYAGMLFAVVPLRNFLPGSPPTGSLIDQGLVIWVLLGLAAAMVIYIVAFYRDRT